MLYWENERFLAYPEDLMGRIAAAGVTVRRLSHAADEAKDPFVEPCEVSRDERMISLLEETLQLVRSN